MVLLSFQGHLVSQFLSRCPSSGFIGRRRYDRGDAPNLVSVPQGEEYPSSIRLLVVRSSGGVHGRQ